MLRHNIHAYIVIYNQQGGDDNALFFDVAD